MVSRIENRPAERPHVRGMFNRISPRYDLLNRLLSAGQDMSWRRKAIRLLGDLTDQTVIDLCCGTGDFLYLLGLQYGRSIRVAGIDFAGQMLHAAEKRLHTEHAPTLLFCQADALCLPVRDNSVSAITIGFGIRNIVDKEKVFAEILRVLAPQGKLVIIEPAMPENRLVRFCFTLYFRYLMPLVGGLISGDRDAYRYLHDTVAEFPRPHEFATTLQQNGFVNVRYLLQSFSTAAIYYAEKEG
jgi:demethylmenaquinone methyltransferase/2-methoxy-6-polyprenyl-1,4-benzoquinol methylase